MRLINGHHSLALPQIGELNSRVRIRRWQDLATGEFDIVQQHDEGIQTWARVEAVGAQTYYGSKQTGEGITHRFTLRWWRGKIDVRSITAEHIIEYDGMRYRVKRVNDLHNARRFIVAEATELGALDV